MNQLIICVTDFKELKINKSKTDKFKDKINDDNKNDDKFKDKFEEKSEDKSDKNDDKSINDRQNLSSTDMLKDSKKNDNDKKNYNYYDLDFHTEDRCKLKNSTDQSEK